MSATEGSPGTLFWVPLGRTPTKNGCTYSTPGTVASFTLENLFSNGDPTSGSLSNFNVK